MHFNTICCRFIEFRDTFFIFYSYSVDQLNSTFFPQTQIIMIAHNRLIYSNNFNELIERSTRCFYNFYIQCMQRSYQSKNSFSQFEYRLSISNGNANDIDYSAFCRFGLNLSPDNWNIIFQRIEHSIFIVCVDVYFGIRIKLDSLLKWIQNILVKRKQLNSQSKCHWIPTISSISLCQIFLQLNNVIQTRK